MINLDDLTLAQRLADAAGAAILPYFRAEFGLEMKADASPVTLADRAAEQAIRDILARECPHDGVIGEEFGETPGTSGRTWVLDPIDGTRSFVAGRPIFGTLIALLEEDRPVLGVIDQPVTRERWVGAKGHPTRFNGQPCQVRPARSLGEAIVASTSPAAFAPAELARFQRLAPVTRDTVWGGDCYNYALVALGQIDMVVEAGLKLHDFAALVPVIEGAGGVMLDWNGRPLSATSAGDVIAASDNALAEAALAVLNA